jgi:hypothetical protein
MGRRRTQVLLIAATALSRFVFRSHYLYDIDSVNFALAMKRFDPSVHQAHPPGYFLYVVLGRLSNLIFHDANAALVAISILFSCGAVAAIYALTENWFGGNAALFSGLVFLFSPLAWFHGTVALTYIVESFFSALTGYLCWRMYCGGARLVLPSAVVLGVAAGFRPSSLLLLGPVWLFSLRVASRKQAAAGVGVLALTLGAWFVPMIRIAGWTAYFSSFVSLWLAVPSRGMVFNSPLVNSLVRGVVIVGIYFLCFGCAALLPFGARREMDFADRRKARFTWVWITPGLLLFTLIYLKFVNGGYLLALAPPVCVWMGRWASTSYANVRVRGALKIAIVGGCAAANTAVFIWAPFYCSYGAVRRFEGELENIVGTLPQIASPRDTMIVGFDSHFLGYRHAGYYLPDYLTVEFPEVAFHSGTRVFVMQYRDTRLESGLPGGSAAPTTGFLAPVNGRATVAVRKRAGENAFQNFVIFPLPRGDGEYSDYMAVVRKRFPPGALRTVTRGGHEYSMGSAADLRFLFP